MIDVYTKRKAHEILRGELTSERSSFISHWKDLADFILPRRARFTITDSNRGDKRNQKIIDGTATLAARTLQSGMMAGITSPARPWFRLTTPDPDLADFGSVKEWLHLVTQRMTAVFLRSNLYNTLPIIYKDMGVFGTSAMLVEEDFENVLRTYSFPIGSYMIANNELLKVNVFMREFRMTVRQLILKFGSVDANKKPDWSAFSSTVKNLWDKKMYEEWIDVCHVIEPNPDYDPNSLESKYKKFKSSYFEIGYNGQAINNQDDGIYLRESGYSYFPVLCPRWEISGEDVYGTSCPGMDALGDVKQLQLEQKRKAQGIEKGINPPMVGPTSLKTTKTSILPGDITYSDEREGVKGFRAAHEVRLDIDHLLNDITSVQNIIRRAFYEDLFLMLASSDRREITAREVEERHEEKMIGLGPVLEQLNQDLLDPLIDIAFDFMDRQEMIPPPPPELQGQRLKVDYVSVMAQAQKLVGISGIERFASFTANIANQTQDLTAIDKVNIDELIDEHGNSVGVPPRCIRTAEQVAEIRAERAKSQQAAQAAETLKTGAGAAKDLSKADLSENNALSALLKGGQHAA